MATTKQEKREKSIAVAKYAIGIGDQNGKNYSTGNKDIALLISELLTKMVMVVNPDEVKEVTRAQMDAFKVSNPTKEIWTYICMYANWLSWGWHAQDEPELSQAWADAWYKLNDFSLDNLKGKDLSYYIETTD